MPVTTILALMINFIVIQGNPETVPDASRAAEVHFDVYSSAISRAHYNPWFCNYFKEPGYKCTDCSTALHCFPGNFALLIQCSGQMPYCSNGYCSSTKSEKCADHKFKSTDAHEHELKETNNDVKSELNNPNNDVTITSPNSVKPKSKMGRFF